MTTRRPLQRRFASVQFLFLLLAATAAPAQDPWRTELRDAAVPMRDGKTLAADVYLPAKSGKYPTVLIQTPYDKKRMGAVLVEPDAPTGETGRGAASDLQIVMDRERYAYVVLDWRGFFGSKTAQAGVNRRTWRRGLDGYDCVEWIAAQSWSNGKVGTWGGSALGKQQLDTAAEHPPHLVCMVPLIAAMGQRYESYYEGGVLLEGHVQRLDQLGFGVGALVRAAPRPGALAWSAAERKSYRPEAIAVPSLLITGWWDNDPDHVLQTFEDIVARGGDAARKHSRLLIGPWDHVSIGVARQGDLQFPGAERASGQAAKAFLDRWLRDEDAASWDATPRVRYWVTNETAWRATESWSGLARDSTTLYLDAAGRIAAAKPAAGDRVYRYDPREPSPTLGGANLPPMKHGPTDQSALGARKDVLVYSTGKLDRALRVNGKVELSFTFSTNRVDCDFTARLCDVGPDGKACLLGDAARHARMRDDGGEWKLLAPGETSTVTLRFPATATTFPVGHELRLYLSSSNWPRYERNPHTGDDHWDAAAAVDLEVTVHHDRAELRLPTPRE
ncbi:MAG: CocE/NonD family hydrolase [Planctomycetes bacterium]|nr:CocE/NonD family hydrolase [Planctomycetota bacterium]